MFVVQKETEPQRLRSTLGGTGASVTRLSPDMEVFGQVGVCVRAGIGLRALGSGDGGSCPSYPSPGACPTPPCSSTQSPYLPHC